MPAMCQSNCWSHVFRFFSVEPIVCAVVVAVENIVAIAAYFQTVTITVLFVMVFLLDYSVFILVVVILSHVPMNVMFVVPFVFAVVKSIIFVSKLVFCDEISKRIAFWL